MRKSIVIYFVFLCLNIIHLNGQFELPTIKKSEIIPPSPQMRAFLLYGDIPVSHFTGVPDISIPLYTLNSGNINIPITLRYHTHSVKPFDANKGNLALGWVIEFGGAITRTIVGDVDENQTSPVESNKVFNENNESDYNHLNNLSDISSNLLDSQSDWFNYILPTGETARFFLRYKGYSNKFNERFKYYLYPNTESKLDAIIETDLEHFRITDSKGLMYNFDNTEITSNHNTSWLLNKITDPLTQKQVFYTYENFIETDDNIGTYYSMIYDENPMEKLTDFGLDLLYDRLHPDIKCNHQPNEPHINHLEMCMGAKKIDCVIPTSPSSYSSCKVRTISNGKETISFSYWGTSNKINKISITCEGKIIKEIIFNTDFNTGIDIGRMLNSITITGIDGTPSETYKFYYHNKGKWKNKSSDYWGFYNDKTSSYTNAFTQQMELDYVKLSGNEGSGYRFDFGHNPGENSNVIIGTTDFTANPLVVNFNLLEKIEYPTKGCSIFEYENGSYFTGSELQNGGGPKIKSITNISNHGKTEIKTYNYNFGEISYNPMGDKSVFITPKMQIHSDLNSIIYNSRTRTISNTPNWGINFNVVYPKVEVMYKNGLKTYKEKYEYDSYPEHTTAAISQMDLTYHTNSIYFSNPRFSKLLKKSTYNSSNKLLKKEEFNYTIKCRDSIANMLVINQMNAPLTFQLKQFLKTNYGPHLLPDPVFKYHYYKIRIPNIQLTQKKVINYTENDSIEQSEKFKYFSDSDIRISSNSISTNQIHEASVNYYYVDSTINDNMFKQNMVNYVSEINYSLNNAKINLRNEYNNKGLLSKVYHSQGIGEIPSLEPRIEYSFDNRGNVTSSTFTGQCPVFYIWGYNYLYPVAKIEGVNLSEFNNNVDTSMISSIGNCIDSSGIYDYLNTIKRNLSNALMTIYLYDYLLGNIQSITDYRGVTTHFESDGFGRLKNEKDLLNQIIQSFDYHYKP